MRHTSCMSRPEPTNGPAAPDIIEQGGRQLPLLAWRRFMLAWRSPLLAWRPPAGVAVLLAAAGLLIGLAAGYVAGDRHAGHARHAASAAPGSAVVARPVRVPAPGLGVTQLGGVCWSRAGHALQLGVQVTNYSAAPV